MSTETMKRSPAMQPPISPSRKIYAAPVLKPLGNVRDLTFGGAGSVAEGVLAMMGM